MFISLCSPFSIINVIYLRNSYHQMSILLKVAYVILPVYRTLQTGFFSSACLRIFNKNGYLHFIEYPFYIEWQDIWEVATVPEASCYYTLTFFNLNNEPFQFPYVKQYV